MQTQDNDDNREQRELKSKIFRSVAILAAAIFRSGENRDSNAAIRDAKEFEKYINLEGESKKET